MAVPIKIRVGASLDANVSAAFRPIVEAAKAARIAIQAEMDKAWQAINGGTAKGKGGQGPYRSLVREAEKAATEIVETERKKQARIAAEEAKATRRREAAERYVARIRDRYFAEQQRNGERADRANERARARDVAARGRVIGAIGRGTVETVGTIGRGALGVAGSVARGAGVNFDLASYVAKNVELETRATELSAAGYQEAKPGETQEARRNVRTEAGRQGLVEFARDIGAETAFDPTAVIQGMQAFVGKTGDLKTAEKAMGGLAVLSRATGTNLDDMVSAAGDAANALGDVGKGKAFETHEAKGKKLVDVMRMIAGQGKVGAVEIKDLAVQMAKLAAASTAFGGDAQANLEFMGGLAQMARATGGAASATQAATAVAGFVNTLKTPARLNAMISAGMKREDVYDEAKNIRAPQDIIKRALTATQGDPMAFKKIFANVVGARAVEPAAVEYRTAFATAKKGGADDKAANTAALAAVDALFAKFTKPISEKEMGESASKSMETTAARVQIFNNMLAATSEKLQAKLLPALEKAAPSILKLADMFVSLVSFAVENPGAAITSAIVASIGKAAIGAAASSAVTKLIEGAAGKMTGGMSFVLASAAITIAAATILAAEKEKGAQSITQDISEADKAVAAAEKEFKATGTLSPENLQALNNARISVIEAEIQGKAYQAAGGDQRYTGTGLGAVAGGINQAIDVATTDQTWKGLGAGGAASDQLRDLSLMRQSIDAMKAAIEAQGKQTLKVEVTNLPPAAGPQANTTNTTK